MSERKLKKLLREIKGGRIIAGGGASAYTEFVKQEMPKLRGQGHPKDRMRIVARLWQEQKARL